MEMLALRAPLADGVNVTLIKHDAPTAKLPGHVLVCAKSLAFVPVTVMPLIVSALVPLLVSVTVCALLVVPVPWLPSSDW